MDFPRGTGATAAAAAKAPHKRQVPGAAEKKTKRTRKEKTRILKEKFDALQEKENTPKPAPLSFKRLVEGQRLLGLVKEIKDTDLEIALPNGLVGYVAASGCGDVLRAQLGDLAEDSADSDSDEAAIVPRKDTLSAFFSVGDVLPCVVSALVSNKQRSRIDLSIAPRLVNSGVQLESLCAGMRVYGEIAAVEDKGYVVSLGSDTIKGFLPNTETVGAHPIGRPVFAIVSSAARSGNFIFLTTNGAKETAASSNVSVDTLSPGTLVSAKTEKRYISGLLLSIDGLKAVANTVHLEYKGKFDVLSEFSEGSTSKYRVISIDASNRILLSAKKHIMSLSAPNFGNISIGDVRTAVVLRAEENIGVVCRVDGQLGFCHVSRLRDGRVESLDKDFKIDSKHKCRVVGFDPNDGLLHLSFQESVLSQTFLTYSSVSAGQIVKAKIAEKRASGILVAISDYVRGLVPISHLSETQGRVAAAKFSVGKAINLRVLGVVPSEKKIFLTAKKALVDSTLPIISDYADAAVGTITHGYVSGVKPYGCFVTLYSHVKGLVPLHEIAQGKIDINEVVRVGMVVKCRVVSVNASEKKLILSLRDSIESESAPKRPKKKSAKKDWGDFAVGDAVNGFVINVTNHGCFVKLTPKIVARMKIAEISPKFVKNWKTLVKNGQKITAMVTEIDHDNKRIEISVRKLAQKASIVNEDDETTQEQQALLEPADEEHAVAPVSLIDTFELAEEGPAGDVDGEQVQPEDTKKLSKRAKQRAREEREQLILERERMLASNNQLRTAEDFERALMADPNNSNLWIRFMAHHIEEKQLDGARKCAHRALEVINYREEEDKLNIWTALLNLENNFGTSESFQETFKEASRANDDKVVHFRAINILRATGKNDAADDLFRKGLKKFRESCKAWVLYAEFLFEMAKRERARQLMQQMIQALPSRKHVKAVTRFAQLEFKRGDAERGRTLLEGILADSPKRLDIWGLYLDHEEGSGNTEAARRLYERAVTVKLSSKKMRFLLKKFLSFEKQHGNDKTVAHVLALAKKFVESQSS